jgi:uncharacterized protein with ParB-like and HNH nuclease domain
MSTITPHYRTVQQLLQNQKFAIDEFQREYKWDKKQIEELLYDLQTKFGSSYKPGDEPKKVGSYGEYFLGSIIVSKRENKNYLIDGQQRVASLTLLLIFLFRQAQLKNLPDTTTQTLAPLIYSDNLGELSFNLDMAERQPLLDALFHAKPFNPENGDESVRTMLARYNDIEQNDLVEDLGDALQHFIYWLLTKVGLIEIATSDDSTANEIFETMNDRGKPLSPTDMLKAFLLAPIHAPEQRNHANDLWRGQVLQLLSSDKSKDDSGEQREDANCIKAWLRAQYAEKTRERKAGAPDEDWEKIGKPFHRWVRDHKKRLGLEDEAQNFTFMTKEFPFFAKAYLTIQEASESYTPGLEHVFYNAHNGFTWQSTVLLAPLTVTDKEETIRRKVAVTAAFLDIWIMRRVTNYIRVGYSTASYAMYLVCKDIRRKPIQSLVKTLTKRLNDDDVTFAGAESKGRHGVENLYLNQWSRRYIFHLLARITAFSEVMAGRSDQFKQYVDRNRKNPFDIEHIWADDFGAHRQEFDSRDDFSACRNNIGGLLLLPADVNRSLQKKPFPYKRSKYASENIYAASLDSSAYTHQPKFKASAKKYGLPFTPYEAFGRDQQLERRKLVGELADLVWSPGRLQEIADE